MKGESVQQAVSEVVPGPYPYHETIKDAIRRATNEDLRHTLAPLIKETGIPDSDAIDEVIAAWIEKTKAMCWGSEDLGVPAALLKQKEAMLASKGIVKFDELATEAEVFHALLSERKPGDPNWTSRFRERVYSLHGLLHRLVSFK